MTRSIFTMAGVAMMALCLTASAHADPTYDRVQLKQNSQIIQFMTVNDFDGDGNLDVALAGSFPPFDLTVAFGDGEGGFDDTLTVSSGDYDRLTSGFVDSDEFPDIIGLRWSNHSVGVYLSNGDRTFADPIEFTTTAIYPFSVVTGYINDDAYLDMAVAGVTMEWYSGNGTGAFAFESTLLGNRSGKGICVLDLNQDGVNDLCGIGANWVWLAVADGQGGYTVLDSTQMRDPFPSQFSLGHDVIDFDEDGNPDVLVSDYYPAVEGDSKAHIIMTDGSGYIKDELEIVIPGSLHGMTAFDFNNDNHLDIVASSSNEKRFYIHLGDGNGGVADSFSVSTDPVAPTCLQAGDFLEDGVWDIAAGDVGTGSSVFLRTDEEPQALLGGEMITTAPAEVGLRIQTPRALSVDELRYHVPGARCDLRDVDGNGTINRCVTDVNVQSGTYRVSVWGTPASAATALDLPIEVAGQQLVLARDAGAPPVGDTVNFAVYVGDDAGVLPPSGGTSGAMPTFDWNNMVSAKSGATVYGIQISDTWDFASPLYDVNDLTVPRFTPPAELAVDVIYYWRYRTGNGTTWGDYSDLHAVTISSCNCPYQMDYDADGFLTAIDIQDLIDVLFAGKFDIQDSACPTTRMDFDNDGFTTAIDLSLLIDHLFQGQTFPCDPCDPSPPGCVH